MGRKVLFVVVGLVVLFGGAVGFAQLLKSSQGEDLTQYVSLDQKLDAQIPMDVKLKDETGKEVRISNYFKDRPVVLMLIFYKCVETRGSCLMQFEGAVKAFKAMQKDDIGREYDVLTVSIHPKETPELAAAKKAMFLEQYTRPTASKGWHFMTGDHEQVKRLADAVGYRYRYDDKKNQVVHPTGLVVLTPTGHVSKYFYGTEYPAKYLRDSIVAAGNSQIGGESEEILFGCFQYDKNTGRTRMNVARVLQVTGSLTVLILGLSLFTMTVRSRRNEQIATKEDPREPS